MTDIRKPARGNNAPLSEINAALVLRVHFVRERFGIDGPTAQAICEIAFGILGDGARHD